MDCGQSYFFIDVANALDIGVITALSIQLNNIHNTPSSLFGGKHVVLFADFFQTPPFRNRYNAIWGPHQQHDLITKPFLNNVQWLEPEPLAAHVHTPFVDKIRLLAFGGDDLQSLNERVINPRAFIAAHVQSKIVVVTPSAARCKLLNYGLPFRAAECLNTTLYVSNATDHISFSIGATIAMTELNQLKENVAHCGEVTGRIPLYIGMPCSIVIDATPVWGHVYDIQLDDREMVDTPRPAVVQLKYPPTRVSVKVTQEVLHHNPELKPMLHLEPVRHRFAWFLDEDEAVVGYVVRIQVPLAPRLAILEKDCDGQKFDHLLLDTAQGFESIHSLYLIASRVPSITSLHFTDKLIHQPHSRWLPAVRQALLRILFL
ncbi:MAG: hypothetical protein NXY57DRAFT_967400 [Lentinula lateritia]|nr:MAG: hypothetical protein NXY57DRAFT_967400 [Lentinula lateritia]